MYRMDKHRTQGMGDTHINRITTRSTHSYKPVGMKYLPPPPSISVEMEWGTMNATVNRFSCPLFYAAARKNAASDSGMESEPEDDSPFYDVFISKGLPGSV